MAEYVWKAMAKTSVVTVHQSTLVTRAWKLSALLTTALMVEHAQPQDLSTHVDVHLGTMEQGVKMTKMVSVTPTAALMEEHV